LQPWIIVGLDDVVVVVELTEVESLLDHLAVLCEVGVMFLE
jgi:hypothetical protein